MLVQEIFQTVTDGPTHAFLDQIYADWISYLPFDPKTEVLGVVAVVAVLM